MFPLLFVFLSIAGLIDAGYITYNELNGYVPPCNVSGFKCETVLQSQWAHIGPLPIASLGLVYYTIMFVLAVLHLTEVDVRPWGRALAQAAGARSKEKLSQHPLAHLTTLDAILLVSGFGFLFSLYLVTLMAFVIKAWCLYCLISAGSSAALFLIARWAKLSSDRTPVLTHYCMSQISGFFYTHIIKPLFFQLDAEFVHHRIVGLGQLLGSNPVTQAIARCIFEFKHPSLSRVVDGISLPNPVGLAAGFDYNAQLTQTLPSVGFGFHTIGTVTLHPYEGNTPPRLSRYPRSSALLVNKGFKSPGARAVIAELTGQQFSIPVGISIGSTNMVFADLKEQILDILQTFLLFESSAVRHAYYELNISCPNTKGGQPFTTPDRLHALLTALEHLAISRPVYIKMPIHLSDREVLDLLRVAKAFTIAGVIFGNLAKDKTAAPMDEVERAHWQTAAGYVSGKPTWERSNHFIALIRKNFGARFTIIGTGGIFTPADAAEKLRLGADLVQLITGMIYQGPQLIGQINSLLARQAKQTAVEATR